MAPPQTAATTTAPGDQVDDPSVQAPAETAPAWAPHQGWSGLRRALESGAGIRLVWQLPPLVGMARALPGRLSGFLPGGLHRHSIEAILKCLLTIIMVTHDPRHRRQRRPHQQRAGRPHPGRTEGKEPWSRAQPRPTYGLLAAQAVVVLLDGGVARLDCSLHGFVGAGASRDHALDGVSYAGLYLVQGP